ncbi:MULTISPECIES: OsmC family protein [unclassified Streptomyces]|uniref:OsmC family protein n=1 Tax=Streptomyces millisiae TaxID=3075542 RepID=A0ABU2LJL0_9ACTN|nr:OsmC family protein [Streptomyces sp. DSM 44918]MDT0317768.1 OsmC family protein [Streptomyces sp. DSM 44918]
MTTTKTTRKPVGDVLDTADDPQPGLRAYLEVKRAALLARREAAKANPLTQPNRIRARATAESRSGVRRIRIRQHQIISDSGADFAGYDLGPASPEIQLGVLSSCLTHVFLIQAADLRIPLDSLEVEVQADHDPRAGSPGFEQTPIYPHNIAYTVHVTSPAPAERIRELHEAVERNCPIYNLLVNPQQVTGRVVLTGSPQEL